MYLKEVTFLISMTEVTTPLSERLEIIITSSPLETRVKEDTLRRLRERGEQLQGLVDKTLRDDTFINKYAEATTQVLRELFVLRGENRQRHEKTTVEIWEKVYEYLGGKMSRKRESSYVHQE